MLKIFSNITWSFKFSYALIYSFSYFKYKLECPGNSIVPFFQEVVSLANATVNWHLLIAFNSNFFESKYNFNALSTFKYLCFSKIYFLNNKSLFLISAKNSAIPRTWLAILEWKMAWRSHTPPYLSSGIAYRNLLSNSLIFCLKFM